MVFTVIFSVEMILKLAGIGCELYWADGWNRLDGSIVILSAADLSLTTAAQVPAAREGAEGARGSARPSGCWDV